MRLWRQHGEMLESRKQGESIYSFSEMYGVGSAARAVAWLCKKSDIYDAFPVALIKYL